MTARYSETSNVYVLRNEGTEKLVIMGDPAEIPKMADLHDVPPHHHVGKNFAEPSHWSEFYEPEALDANNRPSEGAWRFCNRFCMAVFVVLVVLMFSPKSRAFLHWFVELVIG